MIPTEEEILKEAYGEYVSGPAIGGFCRGADYMLERLLPHLIEWIPVEDERKPEEGDTILGRAITNLGDPFYILLLVQGGYLSDYGCTYDFDYFSHWARIPLPEAQ